MNTKKLKQLVLDLAIHGKLVPQDPNDEPASELLKRIQADVETHGRASNKSKGKKSAVSSVDLDEVPFEVPEGWCWTTVNTISLDSADGPFGSNLKKEHYTDNQEVRIVQLSNIGELQWRDENVKYTTFEHLNNISRSEVTPGDIIIAKMMPAGRAIICPSEEKKYVLSSDAVRFRLSQQVYNKYLYYAINSDVFKDQVYENVQGVTRVRTSLVKLREYLVPLPPFAEQHRIVAEIEKWFAVIDQLEKNEADLKKSIEQTKKKVLDLAIRGKLVAQNPEDEPAGELLKKIKEEKAKTTKGKKAIADVEIDEVPFELPKGWEWCRLGDLCGCITKGTTPKGGASAYVQSGVGFLRAENVTSLYDLDLEELKYITVEEHNGFLSRSVLKADDILFTIAGSLGRTGIVRESQLPLNTNQAISIVRFVDNNLLYNKYIVTALNASYVKDLVLKSQKVTAIPNLTLEFVTNIIIPLPPMAEQKRIVEKVEEVMGVLERIEGM